MPLPCSNTLRSDFKPNQFLFVCPATNTFPSFADSQILLCCQYIPCTTPIIKIIPPTISTQSVKSFRTVKPVTFLFQPGQISFYKDCYQNPLLSLESRQNFFHLLVFRRDHFKYERRIIRIPRFRTRCAIFVKIKIRQITHHLDFVTATKIIF